jgi:hypothetical protein
MNNTGPHFRGGTLILSRLTSPGTLAPQDDALAQLE